MTNGETKPLVLQDVSKTFGGVAALSGVSLEVGSGEVVCLLGDNGAGKSTLISTITGVHRPDGGQILIDGQPVGRWNPKRARDAGIQTVFQERSLASRQTVARNIFMGREIGRFGWISDKRQEVEAEKLLRAVGLTSKALSAKSQVTYLSGGERQGMAIARAMHFAARILVLDEPTASMSLTQARIVLDFIRAARDRGIAVLLVTHNVADAYAIGDRFVILDRGRIAAGFNKPDITEAQLMTVMEGAAHGGQVAVPTSASDTIGTEEGVVSTHDGD